MSAAAYDMSAFDTAELIVPGPKIETRSYRGTSLEELLPRIQEELGPDAVIVRRREGVVGGFGGFFGKKCIELQVQATVVPAAHRPAGSRAFYDTGDEIVLENDVLEAALAQKESFAALLASATEQAPALPEEDVYDWDFASAPAVDEEFVVDQESEPELDLDAEPSPEEPVAMEAEPPLDEVDKLDFLVEPLAEEQEEAAAPTPLVPPVQLRGESVSNARAWAAAELEKIRAGAENALAQPPLMLVPAPEPERTLEQELVLAGLSAPVAAAVADDVARDFLPFGTAASPRSQARAALARRMSVSHGRRTKRRVVALVGAAGAGKTLAVAKLARAYAQGAGLSVGVLSCEPLRRTLELASLVEGVPVAVESSEAAGQVKFSLARLADSDVVVVDTPALDPSDAESVERVAAILRAVRPTETHLVVAAGTSAASVRALLAAVKSSRLLVTHGDTRRSPAELVSLAVEEGKPFSYLSRGPVAGIVPADPAVLAELVLP